MDISTLSNAYISQAQTQMQMQQNKINNFQTVLDQAVSSKDDAELKKACVEFESYFLQLMYKEMRKTTNIAGTANPKSHSETIFQEMLDEEYAGTAAGSGGIGLANMMYKQMKRNHSEILTSN